jgi:hypothetical protein
MEIWKYELSIDSPQTTIPMPLGARILSLQMQDGVPMLWALVDPMRQRENRVFETFATEDLIPPCATMTRFIGTYQTSGGYALHVFDETPLFFNQLIPEGYEA